MLMLTILVDDQKMIISESEKVIYEYPVSTAKKGVGEEYGSEKTPRGLHVIRAKIGANCLLNTVFAGRRPTGEIYKPELGRQYPERDWILTRIFWLSGLEVGKNRLGSVDTMRRYIYIHGTPDEGYRGGAGSKGCIRMQNTHIIELFDRVPTGTQVLIR
jgi:L,D-transpeptidase YbiS